MGLIPDNLMPSPEEARKIIEDLLRGTPEKSDKDGVIVTSYKDVVFEQSAYCKSGESSKELFSFDESLSRLKSAGFERHPRSQEVFGLIIDDLEGRLSGKLKDVCDDMLKSYGEWLSLAVERKGNVLVAYVDPKNLFWDKNNNKYVVQGRQVDCAGKETFDVTGKQSGAWIDLNLFEDKFIKFMHGRSFNQLPKIIQEGNKRAQVWLLPEGSIRPVGRSIFNNWHYFAYNDYWASRGTSLVTQKISPYFGGFF